MFKQKLRKSTSHVLVPLLTLVLLTGSSSATSLASLDINISGNGDDTNNSVTVDMNTVTNINQSNDTVTENDVNHEANTGSNEIAKNLGSVDITTGSIDTTSSINNATGNNVATTDGCGGCEDPDAVGIDVSNNGSGSTTAVDTSFSKNAEVAQHNNGVISNDTEIKANTGDNTSSKNNGDSSIVTGGIEGGTQTTNSYGNNFAAIGSAAWDVIVNVSGNGADADVQIGLAFDQNNTVEQSNTYDISNEENIDLNTGGNECSKNTDGDCTIETGGITFGSEIENEGGSNNVGGIGGIIDGEDPTDDDNSTDNNSSDSDNDSDDKNPLQEFVDDVLDTLVPSVQAAEDETVLGATELPMTGFGSLPTVSWFEILLGVYMLIFGAYLRHLVTLAQKRFSYNRQNV